MTTNVTKTIINDGPQKLILQLLIESDGTDGELTNYVVLDPFVDSPFPLDAGSQLTLMQLWANAIWFDVLIRGNALNPVTLWCMSRDPGDNYVDFRYFAGLKDRSGVDNDGKILISTNGLTDATGSTGVIVLEFKKN